MDNENEQDQLKAVFGSWIQATGTVISAIGISSFFTIGSEILNSLNLIGNVLQATGNAILADTIRELSLDKIGNEIQAIGNSTVISGILLDLDVQTKIKLDIDGNLLQALGGATSLAQALESIPSAAVLYSIYGNSLQATGNSLQAYAGAKGLRNEDGENINIVGSWIQATGAVISAIGQTKYPQN
ncbi:DUF6944 family repetitive protein [Guptibacillus sedimenti]|uniref:DUF6944 family repetitive protein n=1 Tax=Guptibacillus sedimenti TaxID=3025680 RepID=UPI002361F2CF|nr:hypothetical protein [Pseudalkalibacillus sedimenti]